MSDLEGGAYFDISASVVRQLGEELVSDELTAIIELVKNSYDADATYADIVVDTINIPSGEEFYFSGISGYVSIEDDGIGMDEEDIRRGWLLISSSRKRAMKAEGKTTSKRKRVPLGDKGLGRLSTQRIGEKLELFTCKEETNIEHHVSIDWSKFVENVELSSVPVVLRSRQLDRPRSGTKLVIRELRYEKFWTDHADEVVKGLSQLISPFKAVRRFDVFLTINGRRIDLSTVADRISDLALGKFSFSLDGDTLKVNGRVRFDRLRGIGETREERFQRLMMADKGRGFYDFFTNTNKNRAVPTLHYIGDDGWFVDFVETRNVRSIGNVSLIDNSILAHPGNFVGQIDEFFLRGGGIDAAEVTDIFGGLSQYKQFVSNQVGVRIFRDGFGIRPYGVDGQDWLGLAKGQTSGASFYGLRPQNVIGYVDLTGEENSYLKEKTDREGFIDNGYSRNFNLVMAEVVKIINAVYFALLRGYNDYAKERAENELGLESMDKVYVEMRQTAANAVSLRKQVVTFSSDLDKISDSVNKVVADVEQTPLLTSEDERRLSPLLSDIRGKLKEASELVRELEQLLNRAEQIGRIAELLQPKIETLENQITDFSELASLGLTAEVLTHEIHNIADRLAYETNRVEGSLSRKKIVIPEVVAFAEQVHSIVSALRRQLSHVSPALRFVREKRDLLEMNKYLDEVKEYHLERFFRKNIGINVIKCKSNFIVNVNRGKLTQVIDNIVINSEYWLLEAVRRDSMESPLLTMELSKPYIHIYDNGLGVEPGIEGQLFQPFVSTKPREIGRGLGLFISRQLLESVGCSLTLLFERNAFGRRYKFQIDLSGALHG